MCTASATDSHVSDVESIPYWYTNFIIFIFQDSAKARVVSCTCLRNFFNPRNSVGASSGIFAPFVRSFEAACSVDGACAVVLRSLLRRAMRCDMWPELAPLKEKLSTRLLFRETGLVARRPEQRRRVRRGARQILFCFTNSLAFVVWKDCFKLAYGAADDCFACGVQRSKPI